MLLALAASAIPLDAEAASSDWATSEGGAVRLVTSETPGPDGKLRGALQIDLKPGWKTYWRDPGQAGIPPSLSVTSDGKAVETSLHFPPPRRIDDGFADAAGYVAPVSLAVELEANAAATLDAQVFLGVCKSICVPLKADLKLAKGDGGKEDGQIVDEAWAALPPKASDGFGATHAKIDGDVLLVEARVPKAAGETQLFLASGGGYFFDLAGLGRSTGGDTMTFSAKLLERPDKTPSPPPLFQYTLISGDKAVSGLVGLD